MDTLLKTMIGQVGMPLIKPPQDHNAEEFFETVINKMDEEERFTCKTIWGQFYVCHHLLSGALASYSSKAGDGDNNSTMSKSSEADSENPVDDLCMEEDENGDLDSAGKEEGLARTLEDQEENEWSAVAKRRSSRVIRNTMRSTQSGQLEENGQYKKGDGDERNSV